MICSINLRWPDYIIFFSEGSKTSLMFLNIFRSSLNLGRMFKSRWISNRSVGLRDVRVVPDTPGSWSTTVNKVKPGQMVKPSRSGQLQETVRPDEIVTRKRAHKLIHITK